MSTLILAIFCKFSVTQGKLKQSYEIWVRRRRMLSVCISSSILVAVSKGFAFIKA